MAAGSNSSSTFVASHTTTRLGILCLQSADRPLPYQDSAFAILQMDSVKVEVDKCVSILSNINAELADLHLELLRRTDVEQIQLWARVEAFDNDNEWRLAVEYLINHTIARCEAILPCLKQQVQRTDKTLAKMVRARPAMSWRVREIDILVADLRASGVDLNAKDISSHLWDVMLDKLNTTQLSG